MSLKGHSDYVLSIKKAFKSTCLKRGIALKMATQKLTKDT